MVIQVLIHVLNIHHKLLVMVNVYYEDYKRVRLGRFLMMTRLGQVKYFVFVSQADTLLFIVIPFVRIQLLRA